jgi:hypothetical protein
MDDWDLDTPSAKQVGSSAAASAGGEGPTARPAGRPAEVRGSAAPAGSQAADAGPTLSRRPRRERTWAGLAAASIILLLVGAVAGYFIARSQLSDSNLELADARQRLAAVERAVSQAEERNWNYYRENEALTAEIADLKAGSGSSGTTVTTPTTIPGAHPSYADGIYLVGEQIAPGEYSGTVTGEVGYWARLRSTDGVIGAIIANGLPRGPFVVTITESDVAVELRGVKLTSR